LILSVSRFKRWKLLLLLAAFLISLFFLMFTNYLVDQLSKKDLAEVTKLVHAFEELNNPNLQDYTEISATIRSATVPIIVTDKDHHIVIFKNIDPNKSKDSDYLYSQLRIMRFYNNPIPIKYGEGQYHYVYYKEQSAITMLRYFPYVQLLLIALFLTISYVAFNASRTSEQNMVWVGMAKETAHQIGTPLSSLMAWTEYLKTSDAAPSEAVIEEIEKDIDRLHVITERFSKIGSTPELKEYNVAQVVAESVSYLKNRISNHVTLDLLIEDAAVATALLNKNLFSWVIENLTKNAVDAMNGRGAITYRISTTKTEIIIDVSDTGKGIPKNSWSRVFEPGFTTKKRGWGLGLSLSKRIVDDYHKGEIYVRDSEPGKGTTFRIRLKKAVGEV
jgi:two-component sensor histidine kinase